MFNMKSPGQLQHSRKPVVLGGEKPMSVPMAPKIPSMPNAASEEKGEMKSVSKAVKPQSAPMTRKQKKMESPWNY